MNEMFTTIKLGMNNKTAAAPAVPTNLALSNATLQESDCPLTVVGSLTCDAPNDIVTWSLTDDAGGKFRIWGAKKDQIALSWVLLDRGAATSYNVTARATGLNGHTDKQFTISIADVTDPGELATLPVIAYNFLSGVTLSGNAITGVTAKWSSTGGNITGHSGNEPQVATDGPNGNNTYAKLPNDSYFEFTSTGSMSNFDVSIACCFDTSGVNRWFFASSSNTANFIRGGTTTATFFWGDGSSTVLTYTTAVPINTWGVLRFTYAAAGGSNNVKAFWNGSANGTATKASQTMTFTRMGKTGTTATTGPWRLAAATIYPAVLASTDPATLSVYLTRFRAQRRYVAASGSDASLTPWLSSTPLLTVATAWTSMTYRATAVILNPGDTFATVPVAPLGNGGLAGMGFYFGTEDPYSATRAKVHTGQDLTASTWTNTSGDIWTTAVTVSPAKLVYLLNADLSLQGSVQEIIAGDASTTDWTFSWAAGTVTVKFPAAFVPNGKTIWACSGTGWTPNLDYLVIASVGVGFSSGVALDVGTPNGTQADIWNCAAYCNNNDGINATGTGVINTSMCESYHNAQAGSGSNGDGFSSHGTTTTNYWRCISKWNGAGGFRHLDGPTLLHDECWAEGNAAAQYLQLTSVGTASGSMTVQNSVAVLDDVLGSIDTAILLDTGVNAGWGGMFVYNCAIYSKNAGTGIGIDGKNNTGKVTAKNNIIDNFATGLSATAGGIIAEDYNCLFGNTTARTNVGTGAHSIATDPKFTNPGARDFTLQGSSPCIGAGTNLSLFADYNNRRWGTTIDMGVYNTHSV